jgi:hypothetical protein
MAPRVSHLKVSAVPDAGDPSLVEPSDWNADHVLSGVQGTVTLTTTGTSGPATFDGTTLNIPNYADTGITQLTGDVTAGPGSGSKVATLASVVTAGTSTKITYDAKGRVTAGAAATPADLGGLGTGVATALGINVGSAGAPVINGGALGTPSGGVATNITGLPAWTSSGLTLPAASQTALWDGVSAQGSDIASAATLNLTTATGPIVNITGTTTVTAITLAQGDWRLLKLTGAVPFTLGSSLIFNGVSSATSAPSGYAGQAGDLLLASGEASGVVRLYTMSPSYGTFTPAITFATPGDLSVSYTAAATVGFWWRYGNIVNVTFNLATSSFTYTTASSFFQITGLPFANMTTVNAGSGAVLTYQGITKASYTTFIPRVGSGSTLMTVQASGSGQTTATLTTADVPSGGSIILRGSITYITGS